MICDVKSPTGAPSLQYGGLLRYYQEAGLDEQKASGYATADWVHTDTDSFKRDHQAVVTDPNGEPELYYSDKGESLKLLSEIGTTELHRGLAADVTPVYMKIVDGMHSLINAVRAKPSVLGYNPDTHPYNKQDNIRIVSDNLFKRFAIPVNFMSREEAVSDPAYKGQSAWIKDGKVYAVEGQASVSNLVHEVFGHPILELLEKERPHVYAGLVAEAMRNEKLKELVRQEYPAETNKYGAFTDTGKKEVILKALELDVQNKLKEAEATGLKPFIRRLWEAVKDIFKLGKDKVLDSLTTIEDLSHMVLGTKDLNLAPYIPGGTQLTMTGAKEVSPAEIAKQLRNAGTHGGTVVREEAGLTGDRYIDKADPSKVIRRMSEVVDCDFSGDKEGRNYEEEAEIKAERTFINLKVDPNDPSATVTIQGVKKPLTKKELKYHYIRQGNNARSYGKVAHKILEIEMSEDASLEKELTALASEKRLPSDSKIVIQDKVNIGKKFQWLFGDPNDDKDQGAIGDLKRMLGYDLNQASEMVTERIIYDKEWGTATTRDATLIYEDRELGEIDYKFGNIEGGETTKVMNFVDISKIGPARASRINEGMMSLMMGVVMTKKMFPQQKWKYMKLISLRNSAVPVKPIEAYSLQIYLDAISKWEAKYHPDVHEKNVKAGLYDINNYFGETLERYKMRAEAERLQDEKADKLARDPIKEAAELSNKLILLNSRVQSLQHRGTAGYEKALGDARQELQNLAAVKLQLSTTTLQAQEVLAMDDDMPLKLLSDNLNHYDVGVNMLVALKDFRNERAQQREERKVYREKVHKTLMDELKREKGVSSARFMEQSYSLGGKAYYKGDGSGFWDFLFVEQPLDNGEKGTKIRLISKTKDKEKYARLQRAERAYVDYITAQMEEGYNKALQRKVLTADISSEKDAISKAKALGLPEKWNPEDAMVYLPMLDAEERERDPGVAAALNRFGKGIFNAWVRDDFDLHAKTNAGLPVKFLSMPEEMKAAHAHSLNGEHMFLRFMEHMDHIELMDEVFAVSKGIETMMEYYTIDGKRHYKNALDYLQNYIIEHIEGRKTHQEIFFGRLRTKEGKIKGSSLIAIMENARRLTTFSTLSLQPVLAGLNGTLITGINFKTALTNDMAKRFFNVKNAEFGTKEMAQGYKDFLQLQSDIAADKQESNKLYHILREWKWAPDNYSFATMKKNMGYVKDGALDSGHLLFMHAITENMGNVSILSALLRAMKVDAGGKQISVYDAYDVSRDRDKQTGKPVTNLIWKAGVRGYIKKGEVQEKLTKLTTPEIDNLRKLSARLTGDYRQDERGAAEMNAVWNLAKQFRRYMVRYAKNMWEGKKLDPVLGKYINTGEVAIDEATGEKAPVLNWMRTTSEGWARTMLNGLLCSMLMYNVMGFKKLAASFGMEDVDQFVNDYKWSNLSDFQKQNMARGAMNFLLLIIGIGFAAAPDDTLLKSRMKRLLGDLTEGGSPLDVLRATAQPFPSVTKFSNIVQYGSQTVSSFIMDSRTREGVLRGQHNLERQFSPFATQQQISDIIQGK